jgi:hypothetical protein
MFGLIQTAQRAPGLGLWRRLRAAARKWTRAQERSHIGSAERRLGALIERLRPTLMKLATKLDAISFTVTDLLLRGVVWGQPRVAPQTPVPALPSPGVCLEEHGHEPRISGVAWRGAGQFRLTRLPDLTSFLTSVGAYAGGRQRTRPSPPGEILYSANVGGWCPQRDSNPRPID